MIFEFLEVEANIKINIYFEFVGDRRGIQISCDMVMFLGLYSFLPVTFFDSVKTVALMDMTVINLFALDSFQELFFCMNIFSVLFT